MSWLNRLLNRRTEKSPSASPTRRPLYIPHDAPRAARDDEVAASMRLLEKSQLETAEVAKDNFDPYNTGAFNRSHSWDKISKRKTR